MFFLNNGNTHNEKNFFDFEIKDINDHKLELSKFKNKTRERKVNNISN